MNEKLIQLATNYMNNRKILSKYIKSKRYNELEFCSFLYMYKSVVPDLDKFKKTKKIIKTNTTFISPFRGSQDNVYTSILSTYNDANTVFKEVYEINTLLKEIPFRFIYKGLTSFFIHYLVPKDKYASTLNRVNFLYTEIKKVCRPVILEGNDLLWILLAMSEKTDKQIIENISSCYNTLKPNFFIERGMCSLCFMLTAISNKSTSDANKFMEFYNYLKENGIRYSKLYEMNILFSLFNLNIDNEKFLNDFLEVDKFLKKQKNYGFFFINKKKRYLHTCIILAKYYNIDEYIIFIFLNIRITDQWVLSSKSDR